MYYKLTLNFKLDEKPDKNKIIKIVKKSLEDNNIFLNGYNFSVDYYNSLTNMPEKQKKALAYLHYEIDYYIAQLFITKEQCEIEKIANKITLTEFKMQKVWGFELNRSYHIHWLRSIFCECNKKENKRLFGKDFIINPKCPIHKHQMNMDFSNMVEQVQKLNIFDEIKDKYGEIKNGNV